MTPRIVAHRGLTSAAPENTLAAFENANILGADGIEFDVQWTADHHLVITHEFDARDCTNGTGLIADLTRDELQRLTITSLDSDDCRCHRIPDFSEVLSLEGLTFEVELKRSDPDFIEHVLAEIDAAGVLGLNVLHAPLDLLDEALVECCHQNGLVAHAANVDEPKDLRHVTELGVDQLSTNRCGIAIQVLRNEAREASTSPTITTI